MIRLSRSTAFVILTVCLLFGLSLPLAAQEEGAEPAAQAELESAALGFGALDFSTARLSFAGPSAFLIRHVLVEDSYAALIFKRDENGLWGVAEFIPEDNEAEFPDLILDFARIEQTPGGGLYIDGILLNGQPLSAGIAINPDATLGMPQYLETGKLVGSSLARIEAEAGLVTPDSVKLITIERDEAIAEVARLGERLTRLQDDNSELETRVVELQSGLDSSDADRARLASELDEARKRITNLSLENDALKQELSEARAAYNAATADGAGDGASGGTGVATGDAATGSGATSGAAAASAGTGVATGDNTAGTTDEVLARIAELERSAAALANRIENLEKDRAALAAAGDNSGATSGSANNNAGSSSSADMPALRSAIQELERENNRLLQERNNIEQTIRKTLDWDGYLALVRGDYNQVKLSGFAGATATMGTWTGTPERMRQTDQNQYFARLDLPLRQDNEALLYSMNTRGLKAGWAGLGIHIYASDSVRRRGYGFGESLLVWLGRDPEVMGNNFTYLELYRSRDDINMERVMHVLIEESISDTLKIEALYQPQEEYITIAINGVEKIRYKTLFDIHSGVEVALRTLGAAEFWNLEVRSKGK